MGYEQSDPAELASSIADARARGTTIDPPASALSLAEGYTVQAEAFRRRNEPIAAYKIGLTNRAAWQNMGVTEPIVGRLAATDLLFGAIEMPSSGYRRFGEAEVVIELGADMPPDAAPFDTPAVVAAIRGVYAGIEICSSRYHPAASGVGALVADNSNAELLVIGDRLSTQWEPRFAALDVTFERSGGAPVIGSSAVVLGDPLAALMWLANWLASNGEGLRKGQFVATGSCTGITALLPDEQLIARFAGAGEAHARIGSPQAGRGH